MVEPVTIIGRDAVILLPEAGDDALLEGLREAVTSEDALQGLVTALATVGVLHLPPFAIAIREAAHLRVLVRGIGTATVQGGDSAPDTLITGSGASTWREETFPVDRACVLGTYAGGVRAEILRRTGASIEVGVGTESPSVRHEQPPEPVAVDGGQTSQAPTEGGAGDQADAGAGAPPVHIEQAPPISAVAEATLAPLGDVEPVGDVADPAPRIERAGDEVDFDFSHLLEETHYRGVEAAAVRDTEVPEGDGAPIHVSDAAGTSTDLTSPEGPAMAPPDVARVVPPEAPALISGVPGAPPVVAQAVVSPDGQEVTQSGDHDGLTIARADRRRLLGDVGATPPSPSARAVQAVMCGGGHPNPAHAPTCRICGGAIAERTVREIQRPTLGRLRMSTGATVELDRSQLIGRRPSAGGPDPTASELPGLVTVPDPDQALSRVHAEVRLEGWDVYVVDRGSKNGTFVEIPGHEPTKLRADEPCLIVPGTKVSLADVVELRYEVGDR